MPLSSGARLGPYEILAAIGAGGMGEVYKARDTRLGRDVAIKILPPETVADDAARSRLLREARLASQVNHPHICTIYEVGEADGQVFIAMELVEGQLLSARLAEGPLPAAEVLRYGQQLADALAHAHARGIVHRDLKSANVVLTPEGRAKVLDFGLARRVNVEALADATTQSALLMTAPGVLTGTPAYMAPEQLQGAAADARSDIWALGVVLYEMAASQRPFQGQTAFALSSTILNQAPPPLLPAVPPPLAAVIERCLAKEPAQRYQRGTEVQAALEAVQAGTAVVPWRGWRALGRRPWRLRTVAGLVALLVIAAVVAALDVGGLRSRLVGGTGGPARAIRLAVLPFVNDTGDADQEWFSDGLTGEMITQLGRLHPGSLDVIARTSVMGYKKSPKRIDEIARELGGVDYVLEGSARREVKLVRISAELVKVADQTQVWADSYERELAGILVLQSEVAGSVAKALAMRLLPAEQARLGNVRAVNPDAYDAYLKGSQYWIKMTKGDLDTAERYFRVALEEDPNYAAAYTGLATVWGCRNQTGMSPPAEAVPKMKEAALKAVSLDDSLAEAHAALAGLWTWHDWNFPAADAEWKRAVQLNPNYADGLAMYSHYLMIVGRPHEAMQQIDRSLKLDPFNVTIHSFYALDLVFARRYDDAIAEGRNALKMQSDNGVALGALYMALAAKGMEKEALDAIKSTWPSPDVHAAIDRGFAEGGFRGAMRRGGDVLADAARRNQALPTEPVEFYVYAGDTSRALDWLERAYEARDPNLPYLRLPIYDPLRSDPRFQSLLRRMGLPL